MAKKGTYARVTGEWAKHLRKIGKKFAWNREKTTVKKQIEKENFAESRSGFSSVS